jgi:hypothetical protein
MTAPGEKAEEEEEEEEEDAKHVWLAGGGRECLGMSG